MPVEQRGKNVKELDLCRDSLPVEKALGITWNIEKDVFTVSVKDKEKTLTKRGLLSTIGSLRYCFTIYAEREINYARPL